MSRIETFDDFESTEQLSDYSAVKPFAHRDKKDPKSTLEWLMTNFDQMEKKAQSRMISYQRWHALYKGIHWRHIDTKDYHRNVEFSEKKPRMVNNFILEFVDARVAQMARLGVNFSAIPWNDEQDDINNAKACEKLLKARADLMDFDKICRDADRIKFKYGTSFKMIKWDPSIGQLHPRYKQLQDTFGNNLPPNVAKRLKGQEIRIGDVICYAQSPDRIYPQMQKERWCDVEHIDEIEWVHIAELKAEYPNLAKHITENQRNYYNYSTNEITKPADMIMVRHFYHKPTKHLPQGAYIKYVDDAILEQSSYPFNHGELPFIVDTDIEIENEIWGRPRIGQIEQMQRHYNNIDSSIARDLGIGSAPKWLVPKGAAEFRSMNNDFTIVEFKGPTPPQLIKNNPVSNDAIAIQDRMESRMSKLMKVYDISRGEVPTGVTANSALRFLDEQESQTLADDERKRKKAIIEAYRMMLNLMAQYYKPHDGRMLRILGKDNTPMIESMQKADFTQIYDIQIQNTSALPDTKTGKISAIIDLNTATQTDPVFGKEEVIKMLDLGMDESFVDQATISANAAKTTYEYMIAGKPVPEPQMHDDLMVHYTLFFRNIQSFQFKTKVDLQIQQNVYQHIKTLEGLLFLKSMKNPKLAMELQELDYFPSFFELPAPPAPMQGSQNLTQEEAVQTGQMKNTQETIDAQRAKEAEQ